MTTAELHALFPAAGERPSAWRPGTAAVYDRLRAAAVAVELQADRIWIAYWWNDRPAAGTAAEAHVFQATDLLLRLSGLLVLDAAMVAEGVL